MIQAKSPKNTNVRQLIGKESMLCWDKHGFPPPSAYDSNWFHISLVGRSDYLCVCSVVAHRFTPILIRENILLGGRPLLANIHFRLFLIRFHEKDKRDI